MGVMSALPPKADIAECDRHVRFVPKADIVRCGERRRYSITSSAVCRFLHDHIECLDKGKSEREKVDE
jgi:hypothetical protein